MESQRSGPHQSRRGHPSHVLRILVIANMLAFFAVSLEMAKAQSPITALTFSVDSQRVLIGSQQGIRIKDWPGLGNTESKRIEMDCIHDLSFSPDGQYLLIAGGNPGSAGMIQLRSWPDFDLVRSWNEHKDVVYAVSWRGDGREWVSASWDGYCRVCKVDALASHVTMQDHSGPVFAATYLASGQIASSGADGTIVIWDSTSGLLSKVLRQHTGGIHALAWRSGDLVKEGERLLASASEDRTVRFWQPSIGRLVRFKRFQSTPRSIAWTKDGRWLMVGCDDGSVFQLDPIHLTTQAFSTQNAIVMNIAVALDGEICLSQKEEIKKIDRPE